MRLAFRPFRPFLPFLAGAVKSALAVARVFYRNLSSGSLGDSPTFTRASSAYVTDWEGLFKLIPSNAAQIENARPVYNLIRNTGTAGAVVGTIGAGGAWPTNWVVDTGGLSAQIVSISNGVIRFRIYGTASGNVMQVYIDGYPVIPTSVGKLYNISSYITGVSGSGITGVHGRVYEYTAAPTFIAPRLGGSISISSQTKRYSAVITTQATNVGLITPLLCISFVNGSAVDQTLEISGNQLTDVTGQSNQNPAEYVSRGVLSAPYHGYGADGLKYFFTQNGNTVSNNIVTEATGAALPGPFPLVIEPATSQYLLNSDAPATQTTASLATGTYTLWVVGSGSAAVTAGTATITGAGTASAGTPVTFVVTVAGTVTVTVTGSLTRFQLEKTIAPTSYIPSTTTTVTRAQDVISYPLTTPQAQGMVVVKVRLMFAPDSTPSIGFVSFAAAGTLGPIYLRPVGREIRISDGTLTPVASLPWVSGSEYYLGSRWNTASQKMQIGWKLAGSGSWTWGTEATYDGSFPTIGALTIQGILGTIKVEQVSVYDKDKGATWIEEHFA